MSNEDSHNEGALLQAAREACQQRLWSQFESIFEKYGKEVDTGDDEVDLLTGDLCVDRGRLRKSQTVAWGDFASIIRSNSTPIPTASTKPSIKNKKYHSQSEEETPPQLGNAIQPSTPRSVLGDTRLRPEELSTTKYAQIKSQRRSRLLELIGTPINMPKRKLPPRDSGQDTASHLGLGSDDELAENPMPIPTPLQGKDKARSNEEEMTQNELLIEPIPNTILHRDGTDGNNINLEKDRPALGTIVPSNSGVTAKNEDTKYSEDARPTSEPNIDEMGKQNKGKETLELGTSEVQKASDGDTKAEKEHDINTSNVEPVNVPGVQPAEHIIILESPEEAPEDGKVEDKIELEDMVYDIAHTGSGCGDLGSSDEGSSGSDSDSVFSEQASYSPRLRPLQALKMVVKRSPRLKDFDSAISKGILKLNDIIKKPNSDDDSDDFMDPRPKSKPHKKAKNIMRKRTSQKKSTKELSPMLLSPLNSSCLSIQN
ncbi:hypothetical protein H4219_001845 [Mycoemilia scoparia]|uniref:Uncharacterized protein n=1 Tax=Mycoemilia scoparia TaxID=417184 RepID=A0A9W8DVH8_9FUNG|nr:hypothetical protein H4219_001845 [Mycoemilia scoparia]